MVRGQGVTKDLYFTRLRSKFEFYVICRMKVGKVLKFDSSKFGFIIQILAKRSASGARSNFSGAERECAPKNEEHLILCPITTTRPSKPLPLHS